MDEKKVREAIEVMQDKIHTLEEMECCYSFMKEINEKYIELYNTAIEALEKQLAEKADKAFVKFMHETFEEKFCPKCNELLDFGKYCPNCGQRIDRLE